MADIRGKFERTNSCTATSQRGSSPEVLKITMSGSACIAASSPRTARGPAAYCDKRNRSSMLCRSKAAAASARVKLCRTNHSLGYGSQNHRRQPAGASARPATMQRPRRSTSGRGREPERCEANRFVISNRAGSWSVTMSARRSSNAGTKQPPRGNPRQVKSNLAMIRIRSGCEAAPTSPGPASAGSVAEPGGLPTCRVRAILAHIDHHRLRARLQAPPPFGGGRLRRDTFRSGRELRQFGRRGP